MERYSFLPKTFFSRTLRLLVLALLFAGAAFAQSNERTVSLTGYVKDKSTGETLIGAVVSVKEAKVNSSTNAYGFFSATVPQGSYTVAVRYIGYETIEKTVTLNEDLVLNLAMSETNTQMKEVVVTSDKTNRSLQSTQSGVVTVPMKAVKQVPALLGEADVVRTIQLLPGVTTIGEGAPGFNVRGGGVDHNLILLDEAPVYNGSHLLGFFSVFNPDAVKDLTLMKGGMPARFGGRLSSLLDVRMKEGNDKTYSASGGIGTVASRLLVEGPIKKESSSFIVAGRRSYADMFFGLFNDSTLNDTRVYFYDLSAKVNFKISETDRLYVSNYAGRDVNKIGDDVNMNWGNRTTTVRWNHIYNSRLFSNTSAVYSDYDYMMGMSGEDANSFEWKASIVDLSLKAGWSWYVNPSNTIHFGGDAIRHQFRPGKARPLGSTSAFNEIYMPEQLAYDYAAYWDHEAKLGKRFNLQYGLRYSGFQVVSASDQTLFEYAGDAGKRKLPVNPTEYGKGETIKWYHNIEPRLAVKYDLTATSAIKAGYSRTAQNLHYVSNTAAATPLDIWVPSSLNIKPELADEISAGYFYAQRDNIWEASAELYYREMKNQIDFISGAELLLNRNLEGDMLFGDGRAYGAEFMVRKNSGRLNGWVGYTLSRTERKIGGLNNNEYFAAKYDKTHALSLVGMYAVKPRTLLSASFSLSTGTPVTVPHSRFDFEGFPVQYGNGARNNFRQEAYHRLDLSATFRGKNPPGRRYQSEFVVSVYNALNRKNPYTTYFRPDEEAGNKTEAVRYSVIGMAVPAVTWNFKF
ncbi:MAG TPA: TonB-dependent receptor [Sphingobacteriaceae bacterium]